MKQFIYSICFLFGESYIYMVMICYHSRLSEKVEFCLAQHLSCAFLDREFEDELLYASTLLCILGVITIDKQHLYVSICLCALQIFSCSPDWPQTHSVSKDDFESQIFISLSPMCLDHRSMPVSPIVCGTGDQTHELMHMRQKFSLSLAQVLKHPIECPDYLNLSYLPSAFLFCIAQKMKSNAPLC